MYNSLVKETVLYVLSIIVTFLHNTNPKGGFEFHFRVNVRRVKYKIENLNKKEVYIV